MTPLSPLRSTLLLIYLLSQLQHDDEFIVVQLKLLSRHLLQIPRPQMTWLF